MAFDRIVIVGGSLAGLSAAEALRSLGFAGEVVLVGEEPWFPYDRPPLSKQILSGEWEPGQAALRGQEEYEALGLEWRRGEAAVSLDLEERRVALSGSDSLPFDGLIIATGARARQLSGMPKLEGLHTLRTIDDCLALRETLQGAARVAVVGGGFIGLEVAAVARQRDLEVTVIEMEGTPLVRAVGPAMGSVVATLHRAHGVDFRLGVAVEAIDGEEQVTGLGLSDGGEVAADLVVVGVGAQPNTEWLEGSGLELHDGVVCNEFCEAAAGVFAAGDVARWHNPLFGETMRVEHWTNAVEQGKAAAANLLAANGDREPYAPVPYFWSDQYDVNVLSVGHLRADDRVQVVDGSPDAQRFVAIYGREERLVGAFAFNWPRRLREYQGLIREQSSFEAALRYAAEQPAD